MPGDFESCHKCVAPKRHPGCHDTCPDYAKDRAAFDEKNAEIKKQRQIDNGIRNQKYRRVDEAFKKGTHKRRVKCD